jgi:hypothetical protein
MPLITGEIHHNDGAVIVVCVGVSRNRKAILEKVGFRVPPPVPISAQIDTGSAVTAFMPNVFQSLEIPTFRPIALRTPSTTPDDPGEFNQYDVSVELVSGDTLCTLYDIHAIASEDFSPDEAIQGLLGRDVLRRCTFFYFGPDQRFQLSF